MFVNLKLSLPPVVLSSPVFSLLIYVCSEFSVSCFSLLRNGFDIKDPEFKWLRYSATNSADVLGVIDMASIMTAVVFSFLQF